MKYNTYANELDYRIEVSSKDILVTVESNEALEDVFQDLKKFYPEATITSDDKIIIPSGGVDLFTVDTVVELAIYEYTSHLATV